MRTQAHIVPAVSLSLLLALTATAVYADDFGECMRGFDRYLAHESEYKNTETKCNAEIHRIENDATLSADEIMEASAKAWIPLKQLCAKIEPGKGHAACEKFTGTGSADKAQIEKAKKANEVLKKVYDSCSAQ